MEITIIRFNGVIKVVNLIGTRIIRSKCIYTFSKRKWIEAFMYMRWWWSNRNKRENSEHFLNAIGRENYIIAITRCICVVWNFINICFRTLNISTLWWCCRHSFASKHTQRDTDTLHGKENRISTAAAALSSSISVIQKAFCVNLINLEHWTESCMHFIM